MFVQHIKQFRDRLPRTGTITQRLCVGFSLLFSHPSHIILGTSGLPPVLYWVSSQKKERKKKKKKGNGHMSAKSSPFYRNFLKALLIAIMCVISQCSDSSNHKGSISCKIFIWACCNPEQPVAFQIRGKEEWTLHRLTSVFYTIPWAWDTSSS